jgi:hypothetical protein
MPKFDPTEETHEDRARATAEGGSPKKFSEEIQKAIQRDDREQVQKQTKALAPKGKNEKTGVEYLSGRIFEPRCHVCQHPHRDWIEMMLIKGASYKGLQERVPPLQGYDKLDRRGISNHHQKHMDLEDAAIRAILEREATLVSQDYEEGVEDAVTKRGVLEVMLRKGYEDLLSGITTVEPRDLIQLAKVLGEMDTHAGQVGLDEARAQVQIFIQAIKNVCDLDTQGEIAREVKRLRSRENIDVKFEEIMSQAPVAAIEVGEPSVIEATVVEDPDS